MSKKKPLNRRSFLRSVTGAALALGAFGAVSGTTSGARAQPRGDHGPNNDTGPNNDRSRAAEGPNQGNAHPRSGDESGYFSDNDDGRNADPKYREHGSYTGYTDTDSGPKADETGEGRGPNNILNSDIDIGPNSDPIGGGRGGR